MQRCTFGCGAGQRTGASHSGQGKETSQERRTTNTIIYQAMSRYFINLKTLFVMSQKNVNNFYLNTSKFKLEHAAGGGFDKNSWKQLRGGFYLSSTKGPV